MCKKQPLPTGTFCGAELPEGTFHKPDVEPTTFCGPVNPGAATRSDVPHGTFSGDIEPGTFHRRPVVSGVFRAGISELPGLDPMLHPCATTTIGLPVDDNDAYETLANGGLPQA